MKIKQTKTVKIDGDYHEERITITGMPKDVLVHILEHSDIAALAADRWCLANDLIEAVECIAEGTEIEL